MIENVCVCLNEKLSLCQLLWWKKRGKGILLKWLSSSVCLQDIVWNFHFLVGAEELQGRLLAFCSHSSVSLRVALALWPRADGNGGLLASSPSQHWPQAASAQRKVSTFSAGWALCQLPSDPTSGQAEEGEVGEHRKKSISFNPACFQFLNFSVKSQKLWPQDTHSYLSQ